MAYKTHVGSLQSYKKGVIELDDDLRKYAFSNVFEVAGKAAPFERVAVVQNLQYVAEVVRADSPWFAAPHDEFAIVMDGEVTFHFVKLADDQVRRRSSATTPACAGGISRTCAPTMRCCSSSTTAITRSPGAAPTRPSATPALRAPTSAKASSAAAWRSGNRLAFRISPLPVSCRTRPGFWQGSRRSARPVRIAGSP